MIRFIKKYHVILTVLVVTFAFLIPKIIVKAFPKEYIEPIIPTTTNIEEIESLNEVNPVSLEVQTFVSEVSYDDVIRCYEVANSLVGRHGSCISIVKAFIRDYYGEDVKFTDKYKVDKPKMGDIIYYDDGGVGYEHWAVYLDENHSLQGNFNGRCIIMNGVSISTCENPEYFRIM